MQNTAKNTLSDAAAPPIAPDKPAEADVPAIVLTAAQPGGGGRLPPLTPPTPPEHNPRDFGRYWPIAAAILTIDLPESAAAANRQNGNIAHHKSTREQATVRVAEIRDELAKRERGEQNKRGLMDRLLAGKPDRPALERQTPPSINYHRKQLALQLLFRADMGALG